MIPSKLLEIFFRALFKHPKIMELFKYKDEPNDTDIKVRDLEKTITDISFKHTAAIDMMKPIMETQDRIEGELKDLKKLLNPIASQFDDVRDKVGTFTKWFDKMKSMALLKGLFK